MTYWIHHYSCPLWPIGSIITVVLYDLLDPSLLLSFFTCGASVMDVHSDFCTVCQAVFFISEVCIWQIFHYYDNDSLPYGETSPNWFLGGCQLTHLQYWFFHLICSHLAFSQAAVCLLTYLQYWFFRLIRSHLAFSQAAVCLLTYLQYWFFRLICSHLAFSQAAVCQLTHLQYWFFRLIRSHLAFSQAAVCQLTHLQHCLLKWVMMIFCYTDALYNLMLSVLVFRQVHFCRSTHISMSCLQQYQTSPINFYTNHKHL